MAVDDWLGAGGVSWIPCSDCVWSVMSAWSCGKREQYLFIDYAAAVPIVCAMSFLRQFLAADDGEIQADLHGDRGAAHGDRGFVADVPAERTRGELLDLGDQRHAVDDHFDRF